MSIVMGVDGGGSKTFAIIADASGNLLGKGKSLGSNYQTIGMEQASRHLRESMEAALEMAGLTYEDLAFVQFALAGADRQSDILKLRQMLAQFPVKRWSLECDTMAGLRTGSPDNVGVVLVCGSGTNAVGRSRSGKVVQTGGFGYLFGDAAGGKSMAVETFRSAVRSWEGREIPSILTEKVPNFFGFQSMEQMIDDFLNRQITTVPAELTIALHQAAEQQDPLAIRILSNVGRELGVAANSVIARMGDFGVDTIPVVLIGSVFQKGRNSNLLASLEKTIKDRFPNTALFIPEVAPVFGAVLMAMDHLHIPAGADIIEKFNAYGRKWNDG